VRAVRFSSYGGPEVLEVREVARPVPGRGELLVRVVTSDINRGETALREGRFADVWPATVRRGRETPRRDMWPNSGSSPAPPSSAVR
jgi:NADPH:quinone reductase-like Zn-dependent oxidoreductase